MKISIKNGVRIIGRVISDHSPEILTGTGIALMLTSVVLAVKKTPEATCVIRERQLYSNEERVNQAVEHGDENIEVFKFKDVSLLDKVKTTWKFYIWPAATFIGGTVCIIGANKISLGRTAAATIACKATEEMYNELESAVRSTMSEKKVNEVKDEMMRNKMCKVSDDPQCEVIETGHGNELCFEYFDEQYFLSSPSFLTEAFRACVAEAEVEAMKDDGIARMSLNDYFSRINIHCKPIGELLGFRWDVTKKSMRPDVYIGAVPTKFDSSATTINYTVKPFNDWQI